MLTKMINFIAPHTHTWYEAEDRVWCCSHDSCRATTFISPESYTGSQELVVDKAAMRVQKANRFLPLARLKCFFGVHRTDYQFNGLQRQHLTQICLVNGCTHKSLAKTS